MTGDDLAGILKEQRGVVIIGKDGKSLDHLQEGRQALQNLTKFLNQKKGNKNIQARINSLYLNGQSESQEIQLLTEKLREMSNLKEIYFNPAKVKLKPEPKP